MPINVAAIVPLDTRASSLSDLTKALDAQTLPIPRFEVVLVDAQTDGPNRERVADLQRRRPNVRVVSGTLAEALEASSAEWVIVLSDHDSTLRPAALERLLERGENTGSDLVLGRVDLSEGGELDDVLARDTDKASVTANTVTSAVTLHRREHALAHGLTTDLASAEAVLAAGPTIATLGSYQCASRTPITADVSLPGLAVDSATAQWAGGVLVVTVQGSAATVADGDVVVAVRSESTGTDHLIATSGSPDAVDGSFTATARLDPALAADGAPLASGRWALTVGVHGHTARVSARRRVPRIADLSSAVVAGRAVVVEATGPDLVLDVGATKTSIVGRVAATDVVISETFRGTLLRVPLPGVEVWTDKAVQGHLLLDKFLLPARIVGVEGKAQLECYLSGLAGRSQLSSRFGTTRPMGLALNISGTGEMSVETYVAPAKPKAAKKATAKKTPAKKPPARKSAPTAAAPPNGGRTLVQRLRGALPKRLDPVVDTITRSPAAVRLYRKAAGLPDR